MGVYTTLQQRHTEQRRRQSCSVQLCKFVAPRQCGADMGLVRGGFWRGWNGPLAPRPTLLYQIRYPSLCCTRSIDLQQLIRLYCFTTSLIFVFTYFVNCKARMDKWLLVNIKFATKCGWHQARQLRGFIQGVSKDLELRAAEHFQNFSRLVVNY